MDNRSQQQYDARRRAIRKEMKRRRAIRNRIMALTVILVLLAILLALVHYFNSSENKANQNETPTGTSGTKTPGKTEPTGTPSPSPSPSPTPTPTPNVVSMTAVGDNLYDWYLLEDGVTADGGFDFSDNYDNLKRYITLGDFAVVNQETPLGGDEGYKGSGVEYDYIGSNTRWGSYHGYSTFNTPDEVGDSLVNAGFNVVTMATNHVSDYGLKALNNSIRYWKQYPEITLLGVHDSAEDQKEITVLEKYGIKIAVLNYTYGVNIGTALDEASYCVDIMSEARVEKDVKAAKELADFVVVFVHWGTEYKMTTNSYQQGYTKLFLKLGVDVVVGAHPHIVQPMEWLTGEDGHKMCVFYSLGNFISMFKDARCELEGMAYIEFYKDETDCYVKEGTIIPLVNHWEYDASVFGKRKNFTVYALQDYTEALAGEHGCVNFSEGKSFGYKYINDLATELWGSNIKKVNWE